MIRPLRRLHPFVIALLAVILAALFIASLVVRKPVPTNPQIPHLPLQAPTGGQR